jgi:hypothetical protein
MNDIVVLIVTGLIIALFVFISVFPGIRDATKLKRKRSGTGSTISEKSSDLETTVLFVSSFEKAFAEIKKTFPSDIYNTEIYAFISSLLEATIQSCSADLTKHINSLKLFMTYVHVKKFDHNPPKEFKEACDSYFMTYLNGGDFSLRAAIDDRFFTEDCIETILQKANETPPLELYLLFVQRMHAIYARNGRPSRSIKGFAENAMTGVSAFCTEVSDVIVKLDKEHKKQQTKIIKPAPEKDAGAENILEIYKNHISALTSNLKKADIGSAYNFETSAYLLFLADLAFSKSQKREAVYDALMAYATKSCPDKSVNLFKERMVLYARVIRGELSARGDCMGFNVPENMSPMAQSYMVYGDLLYNIHCGKDYDNAPVLVGSISSSTAFSMLFLNDIVPLIDKFIKDITRARDSIK